MRTRPRDKELLIPQARISPNREHTYFSAKVWWPSQPSALFHVLYYRWWPDLCWFDTSFDSPPPSNYLRYSCKGMSPTFHKTHAHHTSRYSQSFFCRQITIEHVCAIAILVVSYQASWLFEVTIAVSRRPTFTHARMITRYVRHAYFIPI